MRQQIRGFPGSADFARDKTKKERVRVRLACAGVAFFRLAGRKRARAFAARANVETIEKAEVPIADDFESPKQGQTQRPANCSSDFLEQRKTAQRLDESLDAGFIFGGFHQGSE